jgi:hypothetical protein
MGMFGPMIFDPASGRGKAFVDDDIGYDPRAETLLVSWAADPRWHTFNHGAGLDGEDVGLNRFEPKHFYLLGGNLNTPPRTVGVHTVGEILATKPGSGPPGLLRVNNANYFPTVIFFGGGLTAELIAHDGRAFRDTSRRDAPSPPVRDTGHPLMTDAIAFGAAERYDVLLHPPSAGTFMVQVEFLHWATRRRLALRTIPLIAR